MKIAYSFAGLMILAILGWYVYERNSTIPNIPKEISKEEGASVQNLKVPDGFALTTYVKNIPGARVIEFDPKGRLLVSSTGTGKIFALEDKDNNGVADASIELLAGLNGPHGMAFKCASDKCRLYVAEKNQLSVYDYDAENLAVTNKKKLLDLPEGGNHYTRSLLFMPSPNENTLLISVGSTCNVCHEENNNRATILAYNIAKGESSTYATGLRNSEFMAISPVIGKIFATEMGRDNLGDNIPPDEINVIEKGKNYGWPVCYGKNIHDDNFDKNTYIRNPCMEPFEMPSYIDLPAHSAPLGIAFIPEEGWPEDMWYNVLVAYHGSWNSSTPTGYKIVRIKMDANGKYIGTEDFITGFLSGGKVLGRPVDIKILPGGVAYVSDDEAGAIYRLHRTAP